MLSYILFLNQYACTSSSKFKHASRETQQSPLREVIKVKKRKNKKALPKIKSWIVADPGYKFGIGVIS